MMKMKMTSREKVRMEVSALENEADDEMSRSSLFQR